MLPCQMPLTSDTAQVSGSTRASVCIHGGSDAISTNSPEAVTIE